MSIQLQLSPQSLARLIEQAVGIYYCRHVEACRHLSTTYRVSIEYLKGGGVAAISHPMFGSRLNYATGLGMGDESCNKEDLQVIEDLFLGAGLRPRIFLCPYAAENTFQAVLSRGYVPHSYENVYARPLENIDIGVQDSTFTVTPTTRDETELFIENSVAGFKTPDNPLEVPTKLAQSASLMPDTVLLLVRTDGEVVGCGALALLDTPLGKVAYAFTGSARPGFRSRGVARALSQGASEYAQKCGCQWIVSIANIENKASCQALMNAGFRLVYTRTEFVKESLSKI